MEARIEERGVVVMEGSPSFSVEVMFSLWAHADLYAYSCFGGTGMQSASPCVPGLLARQAALQSASGFVKGSVVVLLYPPRLLSEFNLESKPAPRINSAS